MLEAGCWILDTGCWILDVKHFYFKALIVYAWYFIVTDQWHESKSIAQRPVSSIVQAFSLLLYHGRFVTKD